jgi:hypothetical protein
MSVLLIVVVVIQVAVAYLVIAASMGRDVLVGNVVAAKPIGMPTARVILTASHHTPLISILFAAFAAPAP